MTAKDIITLILSGLAFALSLFQFIRNATRGKKEATLKAYEALQDSAFSKLNRIFRNHELKPDTKQQDWRLVPGRLSKDEWEEVTNCLVKIETFAAGVNMRIYDFKIVRDIGGGYLIRLHKQLSDVIKKKNEAGISTTDEKPGEKKRYVQFEKLYGKLGGKDD